MLYIYIFAKNCNWTIFRDKHPSLKCIVPSPWALTVEWMESVSTVEILVIILTIRDLPRWKSILRGAGVVMIIMKLASWDRYELPVPLYNLPSPFLFCSLTPLQYSHEIWNPLISPWSKSAESFLKSVWLLDPSLFLCSPSTTSTGFLRLCAGVNSFVAIPTTFIHLTSVLQCPLPGLTSLTPPPIL